MIILDGKLLDGDLRDLDLLDEDLNLLAELDLLLLHSLHFQVGGIHHVGELGNLNAEPLLEVVDILNPESGLVLVPLPPFTSIFLQLVQLTLQVNPVGQFQHI